MRDVLTNLSVISQYICVSSHYFAYALDSVVRVCAYSCLTLCDAKDCSQPSSAVHGISQTRTLEWVAISYSRGSS